MAKRQRTTPKKADKIQPAPLQDPAAFFQSAVFPIYLQSVPQGVPVLFNSDNGFYYPDSAYDLSRLQHLVFDASPRLTFQGYATADAASATKDLETVQAYLRGDETISPYRIQLRLFDVYDTKNPQAPYRERLHFLSQFGLDHGINYTMSSTATAHTLNLMFSIAAKLQTSVLFRDPEATFYPGEVNGKTGCAGQTQVIDLKFAEAVITQLTFDPLIVNIQVECQLRPSRQVVQAEYRCESTEEYNLIATQQESYLHKCCLLATNGTNDWFVTRMLNN